ncbi:Glutathione S-transferase GST-6.0 [Roseovarius albus]|uniref:Glutathione S-transferase GST-6.0 n=1 Tax=Roseovarius albus TaxID=1247867 RepID=A0A1X7A7A2_9RHOB|nr:glutathione S-transferase family protein [Roseovarius albus]SLN72297.1 Glutathione S-transferase GST-6.0 [Roseovarius albus]
MKLYAMPGTIAVASAIALKEAGIEFDLQIVDFTKGEQTGAAYSKVNAKGRVPALETPDGILTETGAILEYIAAITPEAGLTPSGAFETAQMREAMNYLASTMHVAHAHKLRGSRWATQQSSFDDMTAKVPETMSDCCAYLESHNAFTPYVMGSNYSLADPWLYAICCWLEGDGVDIAKFPKIQAFLAAMNDRPAVQAVKDLGLIK